MDEIIVGIILAGAVVFTIKRVFNVFQGKGSCECGNGCSCDSKQTCSSNFQLTDKK